MEPTEQPADRAPGTDEEHGISGAQVEQEGLVMDEELVALREALETAQSDAEQQRDLALRTRAEMDNLHKRLERDLEKSRRFALERVMGDFLPVLDSLGATLAAEQASLEQLREGSELTLKMMQKLIDDHGLKEINPLHERFDPELHQAMSTQPTSEHEPDTVVQVFQTGYQLHERLLRPALVVVAKAQE